MQNLYILGDFELVVWSFESKSIRNRFTSKTKILKIKRVELPQTNGQSGSRTPKTQDGYDAHLFDHQRKTEQYKIKKKFVQRHNEQNNILGNCPRNDTYIKNFNKNKNTYFKLAPGRHKDTGTLTFSKTVQQIDDYNAFQSSLRDLQKRTPNDLLWVVTRNRLVLLNEDSLQPLADRPLDDNREIASFEFLDFVIVPVPMTTEESLQSPRDTRNPYKHRLNRQVFYDQRNRGDFHNHGYYLDSQNRYEGYHLINRGPNLMKEVLGHRASANKENLCANRGKSKATFSKFGQDILKGAPDRRESGGVGGGLDDSQIRHRVVFTCKKAEQVVIEADLVFDLGRLFEARLASEQLIKYLSKKELEVPVKYMHHLQSGVLLTENERNEFGVMDREDPEQKRVIDRNLGSNRLFDLSKNAQTLVLRTGKFREMVIYSS